jgi:hypothetical protein
MGRLMLPWGAFLDFDQNLMSFSEQMGFNYRACPKKQASCCSAAAPTAAPGFREV